MEDGIVEQYLDCGLDNFGVKFQPDPNQEQHYNSLN